MDNSLQKLLETQLAFYRERDWEKFHSPKNIVMDIASEVGELVEPFRWISEEQSKNLDPKALEGVKKEIADTFMMLLYLSHKLDVDPVQASYDKLKEIGEKYPVSKCYGKVSKYTEYEEKK